jgi:hypothetical protein
MIADELNINECRVHQIVTQDLNMREVCAKMVKKIWTMIKKCVEMKCWQKCLNSSKPDFLNQVITGDKSWFFEYDPETKRQTLECHTPQSPRHK